MTEKLFQVLENLKNDYSNQTLQVALDIFENGIAVDDILKDGRRAKQAFNDQNEEFYNQLSQLFVQDLNQVPEMYFMLWEPIIGMLGAAEKNLFLQSSLANEIDGDADYYVKGMQYLESGNPELAMFQFNQLDHYVSAYFVGISYMELENHENAILEFELFLAELNITMTQGGLQNQIGLDIAKWNTLNDLGYLYNRVEDFRKAKDRYQEGLEVFSVEDTFIIMNQANPEIGYDEFAVWLNNYVFALERTNEVKKCVELMEIAISKRPDNSYFKSQLLKFEKKLRSDSFAEVVLDRIFKKKQPFDIGHFEATKLLSKEKALEDMILEQIKYGFKVFGKSLELYRDNRIHGRQYYISSVNGFLDLLLIDKNSEQLYIVELKRDKAGIEVVEQIEKYMAGLSKEMGRSIKGIICLHKPDEALAEMIKEKDNIELYTYGFDFDRIG